MKFGRYCFVVLAVVSAFCAQMVIANGRRKAVTPLPVYQPYHARVLPRAALGIMYDDKTDNMAPYLTIMYKWLTFGLGGTLEHNTKNNRGLWTEPYFTAHIGFRHLIVPKLYLTFGASTGIGVTNEKGMKNPYVVGPYVGMDYMPARHVMITAQIMPYSRERNTSGLIEHEVFQEGMIGISYIF